MRTLKDRTKFNVGDKVVCVKQFQQGDWVGLVGTVVRTANDCGYYRVDFHRKSRNDKGHNLKGDIKTETGWSFSANSGCLVLASNKQNQLEFDF